MMQVALRCISIVAHLSVVAQQSSSMRLVTSSLTAGRETLNDTTKRPRWHKKLI